MFTNSWNVCEHRLESSNALLAAIFISSIFRPRRRVQRRYHRQEKRKKEGKKKINFRC
jgi:hypothetical protein